MTVSLDVLRMHLEYSWWANERVLRAASELSAPQLTRDFGTADKSALGTLAHIFAAERVWLHRVQNRAPGAFIGAEDREMATLNREWPRLHEGWMDWLNGHTDFSVLETASYFDLRGNAHTTPLWQIVLHLVNHGAHHRGQVTGFLRTMDHKPPALDLIAFYREMAATVV